MTTSGHFADTHGLTRYERNLTNRQNMVAWTESQSPHGAEHCLDRFHQSPPCRSARDFTGEASAHNFRKILAEQHVYWQEQARNALDFQQAGFGIAAQEYEQAAHDEVHVTVAQATDVSRAEMRQRMGALWKSSRATLYSSSSCVVG